MPRKRKTVTAGPSVKTGIDFAVVPANKKALSKLQAESTHSKLLETISLISPVHFAGVEEGKTFLLENSDKWDGKYAPFVTIRDIESVKTQKAKDLKKRLKAEEAGLAEAVKKSDVSLFKAKLITCSRCESKVNKSYIKDSVCPVCGKDLRSKSTLSSLKAKEKKVETIRKRLADEQKAHAEEAPLRYLVVVPIEGKETNL